MILWYCLKLYESCRKRGVFGALIFDAAGFVIPRFKFSCSSKLGALFDFIVMFQELFAQKLEAFNALEKVVGTSVFTDYQSLDNWDSVYREVGEKGTECRGFDWGRRPDAVPDGSIAGRRAVLSQFVVFRGRFDLFGPTESHESIHHDVHHWKCRSLRSLPRSDTQCGI